MLIDIYYIDICIWLSIAKTC